MTITQAGNREDDADVEAAAGCGRRRRWCTSRRWRWWLSALYFSAAGNRLWEISGGCVGRSSTSWRWRWWLSAVEIVVVGGGAVGEKGGRRLMSKGDRGKMKIFFKPPTMKHMGRCLKTCEEVRPRLR
ncbi:hypothetical protein R6Q59_033414 [Mikania micrantha]